MQVTLPFRQIHLDFHTSPHIPDVGAEFDSAVFGDTMARAHINSVTVFAKCHHGHLYYQTNRPERHPGLQADLDLLERQVEALHKRGIRAPIYISVLCDEYAANTHPEWVARQPDSAQVKWGDGVFAPGWQILDMASPYQEYLTEQTAEVLARFHPVDGIFFDMCWDQPSTTKWFIAGMREAGLNPELEADRNRHAHQLARAYMRRFYKMVKDSSPEATVYFNARPMFNLPEDIEFLEQVEIEALPTGGWGYVYFPRNVRFARTFGKPTLGMTARFHLSWADFGGLKFPAALKYETSQMVSQGAACSIGDQLHPRGTLDAGAYELIGGAYGAASQPLWSHYGRHAQLRTTGWDVSHFRQCLQLCTTVQPVAGRAFQRNQSALRRRDGQCRPRAWMGIPGESPPCRQDLPGIRLPNLVAGYAARDVEGPRRSGIRARRYGISHHAGGRSPGNTAGGSGPGPAVLLPDRLSRDPPPIPEVRDRI